MVQLPATAAIEYVAACWVPGAGGIFVGGMKTRTKTKTKTRTKIRTITRTKTRTKTKTVRGAYARSPQVQCVYAPSRLSVPSIVAWRTNRQKKTNSAHSSAGSRPMQPKFSGNVEVEAHYIFHPSTIWVRPLFTELGPKNPDFAIKQTNICRLSGDITS